MAQVVHQHLAYEKRTSVSIDARRLFGTPAPFRHLPLHHLTHELLATIFLTVVYDLDDQYDTIMTSVTLSQVCARWRHVAISTRGLWTKILFTFPISYGQLSLAVTFLQRSGSYPLDILLDLRDPSWDWELPEHAHGLRYTDMDLTLRLLLNHVKRWCHFQLLSDTWMPIYAFLVHTRRVRQAPMLETLSLSRCNAYFASKDAVFSPVAMGHPIMLFGGLGFEKLREVELIGVHVDWAGSSVAWRNLTVLELKYLACDVAPTIHEFVEMLCASPELQQLSIIGRGPRIDAPPVDASSASLFGNTSSISRQEIQLRGLKRFTLGFTDVDYALRLLSLFSFPNLEELTLECFSMDYEGSSPDATPILEWFSTGQREPLTSTSPYSPSGSIPLTFIHTLSLDGIYASQSACSRFLNEFNELRRLHLSNTNDSDNAFNALATPLNGSPVLLLCPKLQELRCGDIHLKAFVNAMKARAKIVSNARPPSKPPFQIDQTVGSFQSPDLVEPPVTKVEAKNHHGTLGSPSGHCIRCSEGLSS